MEKAAQNRKNVPADAFHYTIFLREWQLHIPQRDSFRIKFLKKRRSGIFPISGLLSSERVLKIFKRVFG